MRWFRNRPLMTKLMLGSALVSGILTAAGALTYRGLAAARDGMRTQYVDYTVAGTDLAAMTNQLGRHRSNAVLAAGAGDRDAADRLLAQQPAIRDKVTAGLDAYAATTLRVSRGGRDESNRGDVKRSHGCRSGMREGQRSTASASSPTDSA